MDFVAIDFETANQRPDSACQVAAVVVQESQITHERVWMVRPPSDYFAPVNISIHGIRLEDVAQSPTMEQVWQELNGLLDGQTILAHNARFDVGVLVASLLAYDVACPNLDFQCTRVVARAAWPGRRGYGLKPIGSWLGIDFQHHDALEDARCCAQIAIAAESAYGPLGTLDDLESRLQIQRGCYRNQRLISPKSRSNGTGSRWMGYSGKSLPSDCISNPLRNDSRYVDRWGFPLKTDQRPPGSVCSEKILQSCVDQPLAAKNIVLLGPLRGQSLEETRSLLEKLGATVMSEITSETHYVVAAGTPLSDAKQMVASTQLDELALAGKTTPQDESNQPQPLQKKSFGIRVLSERQFRAMLPGGAVTD